MLAFTILMSLAIAAVILLLMREVRVYLRKEPGYTLRRMTLRVLIAGMMCFLLVSILVGVRIFHLLDFEYYGNPRLWAAFWGCILLLSGGIICLTIADFRTIDLDTQRDVSRLWHEIAETLAEHHKDV